MDARSLPNRIANALSELDMHDLSVGQVVLIVTTEGTFWVCRTNTTQVSAPESDTTDFVAVWGEGLSPADPTMTSIARTLRCGDNFHVTIGSDEPIMFSPITYILALVKP
jgi:hypothetical protein